MLALIKTAESPPARVLAWAKSSNLLGATARRFAHGAAWSSFGTILSQALVFAASAMAARILGKELFGKLGIIQSTLGMLGAFAGLGFGLTTTKYVSELRVRDPRRTGRIIGFSLSCTVAVSVLIALLLIAIAPALATKTLHDSSLLAELQLGTLLLIFNAIAGTQFGILAGFEAFRQLAAANFVRGAGTLVAVYIGALLFGLQGAIWGLIAAALGTCISSQALVRQQCVKYGIAVQFAARETSVIWGFSLPAVISWTASIPAQWIASTLLVREPNGYSEMAIFTAANQWRYIFLFLPGVLGQVCIPMLSASYSRGANTTTRKILFASISICASVSLPALLLALFAKDRIMSFYGPDFAHRGGILVLIGIAALLNSVQTPVGHLIAASGKMWAGAVMNVCWAAVLIAVAYGSTFANSGANGIALAYVVAYSFHCLWTVYYCRKLLVACSL